MDTPSQPAVSSNAPLELKELPPNASRKPHTLIIILLVVTILAVGGFAALRITGWNPLQQSLSPEQVISKMLDSIPDITSAHYALEGSLKSEPREAGAQPIAVEVPEIADRKAAIVRDRERLSELTQIVSRLISEKRAAKAYPVSLVGLMGDTDKIKDPSTQQQYGYRQDRAGAGFTLHVQLETDAAARAYTKAVNEDIKFSEKERDPIGVKTLIEIHEDMPSVYASVDYSDASPYPIGMVFDGIYQYLPTELDARLAISGDSESDASKENDLAFHMTGSVAFGGASFSSGLDILKQAQEFFVRVNEAPSLGFFDFAALKGKWIKAVPEDTYGTFLGSMLYREGDASVDKQSARLIRQYQLVFRLLKEENLIKVSKEFPQDKTGQERLYHYAITLDRNKFPQFYTRLTEETKKEFGDDAIFAFNEETLTYLKSPEFGTFYDALEKNIQLELWVDANDFSPRKISYSQRLVPPDTVLKLKDSQYRFGIVVGLSAINKPVVIEVPTASMSVDEARMFLTGETIEKIKYERQVAQIEAVRRAIRIYFSHTGRDPKNLNELLQKINDVPGSSTSTESGGLVSLDKYDVRTLKEENRPFLSVVPKDIYTGAEYVYTSDGKTYQLKYSITLPPKQEEDISSYEYDSIRRNHVEGLNTATESTLSLEAQAANKKNPQSLSF